MSKEFIFNELWTDLQYLFLGINRREVNLPLDELYYKISMMPFDHAATMKLNCHRLEISHGGVAVTKSGRDSPSYIFWHSDEMHNSEYLQDLLSDYAEKIKNDLEIELPKNNINNENKIKI
jgi:hypothetical protein